MNKLISRLREGTLFLLLITFIILIIYSNALSLSDFSGRVYEASDNKGISNLVIKLTPPRNLKVPQKITTTDQDGRFNLPGLEMGRYLLEIYQGPTLLYRDVVDLNKETNKNIMLRAKN